MGCQGSPRRGERTLEGLGESLCCTRDVSAYRKADGIKIPEARFVDYLIVEAWPKNKAVFLPPGKLFF